MMRPSTAAPSRAEASSTLVKEISPTFGIYALGEGGLHENLVDEPNVADHRVFQNSIDSQQQEHHHFGPAVCEGELDESRLCLLDTACTACMHSRRWRESYERLLPENLRCTQTPIRKSFHFANGSSTEAKAVVWKIPIFIKGYQGEVYSAEIEQGMTPLLLSISAMSALDMVIHLKEQVVQVRKLDLEVPMLVTKSRHLAIDIAFDPEAAVQTEELPSTSREPRIVSEREDLLVYYGEEAQMTLLAGQPGLPEWQPPEGRVLQACTQQRGIRPDDPTGQMSERRVEELKNAAFHIQVADERMWAALKRHYTLAEQFCTLDFKTTVIFEPFAGSFGTTRVASRDYGWTNSQPMDLRDGYDLLSTSGRRLLYQVLDDHLPYLVLIAFDCRIWSLLTNMSPGHPWANLRETIGKVTLKLIVKICKIQHRRGRYYLIENPAGSYAWVHEGLLAELLEHAGGKFVTGDQCPFGCRDSQSFRPIRKPTGWLCNSEVILNHVGRKCTCHWGSHQPLVGRNQDGLRSKQAAQYPRPLCKAICNGVLKQMQLDYKVMMASTAQHAYALVDEEDIEYELQDREIDLGDSWKLEEDRLLRIHNVPRRLLFVPVASMDLPVPFETLLDERQTVMVFGDGQTASHQSPWWKIKPEMMTEEWTGETEFQIAPGTLTEAAEPQALQPAPMTPGQVGDGNTLKRRRTRTRQLQRGFWEELSQPEPQDLLNAVLEHVIAEELQDGSRLDLESDLGQQWVAHESAQAEVKLILTSQTAKRMRKPQPFAGPLEVPLRRSYLLLENGKVLATSWEEWQKMAPASQVRPLVAQKRRLYLVLFGNELGEGLQMEVDDRFQAKEEERLRKWQALPRELKLAVRRIHVNLGHADVQTMLRCLRMSKASDTAVKATRLFRCEDCPRMHEHPKEPRPSKVPAVHDFNVQIGLDVFSESDAQGHQWSWLNILCQGTTFQVCALLPDTNQNPTGACLLEAFNSHWCSWAGFPERGIVCDRAKYFLAELSEEFSSHGCHFSTAAKASPWQIGQVERHGGLWKTTFKRLVWAQQIAGREEVLMATAATTAAKNSMARKHGFSPSQWVIGRDVRLPAALSDDSEIGRLSAQSLAETPGTRFYRQNVIRMQARESFARAANDSALRRAELRKARPSRGPFPVGTYVFYWDSADKRSSPCFWRGVARVIGHEGSSTVWLAHRGILVAVSPEHLSRAYEEEIQQWINVNHETDLIDAVPAAGGTGFLDLRKAAPPDFSNLPKLSAPELPELPDLPEGEQELDLEPTPSIPDEPMEAPREDVPLQDEPPAQEPSSEDLSASSTSMARMKYESERDAKRAIKSSDFFNRKAEERRKQREQKLRDMGITSKPMEAEASSIPAGSDFDPDLDDYHTRPTRQLSPVVEFDAEAAEREAKRLRLTADEKASEGADFVGEPLRAYMVMESQHFLNTEARQQYFLYEEFYLEHRVSQSDFMFAVYRNLFDDKYAVLAEYAFQSGQTTTPVKKKGRKELKLNEIPKDKQLLFTGPDGSDAREWKAWLEKEACTVVDLERSQKIRRDSPDLIVPTRWVRTNKSEGIVGKEFQAKSRLVVQGFKDKMLGAYRRDAPTASAAAESICLALVAHFHFVLLAKDKEEVSLEYDLVNCWRLIKPFMVLQSRPDFSGWHYVSTS